MLEGLEAQHIYCPYCGEDIEVLIDCSVEEQEYIEDCQVCCRPIIFAVSITENDTIRVEVSTEND
jgi:hypothetical protein